MTGLAIHFIFSTSRTHALVSLAKILSLKDSWFNSVPLLSLPTTLLADLARLGGHTFLFWTMNNKKETANLYFFAVVSGNVVQVCDVLALLVVEF